LYKVDKLGRSSTWWADNKTNITIKKNFLVYGFDKMFTKIKLENNILLPFYLFCHYSYLIVIYLQL